MATVTRTRRLPVAPSGDGAGASEDAPGPGSGLADGACCTPLIREPLSKADATRLAARLKAVADPTRLRLLSLIYAHEGGEACVCDLTAPLGLTQPTISHHLRVLVDAGLVTRDKRGVWAYYKAVPEALTTLSRVISPGD
ncbi:MAG: metalloregulator ArsR/SmtB family transcription factor [Frankia sp.]